MKKLICALGTAIAAPSGAMAQYYQAPPIIVQAPPQIPIVILGDTAASLVLLPFNLLGSIFTPSMQSVPLVSDGMGGFVPVTNSRYDLVTGEFLPPEPPPPSAPSGYAPPPSSPPPMPARRSRAERHQRGCYASDGTLLSTEGDCATSPRPIPDTREMQEEPTGRPENDVDGR